MIDMETQEYNFIKREILSLTSINLDFYKTPQMQRRLNTLLRRSGYTTWQTYFQDVRQDANILTALKDYLTINVSSFFRDTEKYVYLRDTILPALMAANPNLRIWSAGCSRGQEPYTVAMLLAEASRFSNKHTIIASDLDQKVLQLAETGGPYIADDVVHLPPDLLQKYFKKDGDKYWIDEKLKRQVQIQFRQQNLLADPFEQNFDLIICRNVVIYFTGPVKDQLYQNFYHSLKPGGILFVGGTEIVSKATDIGFEIAGISFYRRKENG